MFCPEEIELSGAEVRLRPMRIEDIDALALAAQEDRQHYLFNWVPDSVADTRAYVDRALAARDAGQRFPFVVEWQGRIVGTTSYSNYQPWQWGKHGADKQRDTPDVVEIGSTWSIERLGTTFEGIRRADVPGWDGTVRHSAFFSMVAQEWPEAKAAMETRLYG